MGYSIWRLTLQYPDVAHFCALYLIAGLSRESDAAFITGGEFATVDAQIETLNRR